MLLAGQAPLLGYGEHGDIAVPVPAGKLPEVLAKDGNQPDGTPQENILP